MIFLNKEMCHKHHLKIEKLLIDCLIVVYFVREL